MQIIPADRRVTDARGVKLLVVGPSGVGKTSLLRTVDPASTLFVDIEAGDLAVQDLAVDTLRPRTWPECRDLAVALAGANPRCAGKRAATAPHTMPRFRISSATSAATGRSSSTASPPLAGCASAGPASSRKRLRAAARRICAAPTDYTGAR